MVMACGAEDIGDQVRVVHCQPIDFNVPEREIRRYLRRHWTLIYQGIRMQACEHMVDLNRYN